MPAAIADKMNEMALRQNNRNVVGYDLVRIRSGSLSALNLGQDNKLPVNSVMPPAPPPKTGKKSLLSIDEGDGVNPSDNAEPAEEVDE